MSKVTHTIKRQRSTGQGAVVIRIEESKEVVEPAEIVEPLKERKK